VKVVFVEYIVEELRISPFLSSCTYNELFVTCCIDVKAAPGSRYQLSIPANENFKSVLTTFCISLLCSSLVTFLACQAGHDAAYDVVGIVLAI